MKSKLKFIGGLALIWVIVSACGSENANQANWDASEVNEVNNLAGVSMSVKEGSVSKASATVVIENESDSEVLYGKAYELEKKVEEEWYKVPIIFEGNYGFEAIGYTIAAGSSAEIEIEWDWLYGKLDKGEYRILKGASYHMSDVGSNNTLAAEFTVK
ncbi:immunoglobulin-like domain-containing protein [Jeotgalibacillus salarius]|uniref:Bacterial Ig-like domain-containing protein n=1 Tax=Jeotgalibacillus salarius TaxID=546023 RepID=A0A4Y8LN69_9BACL|nr:immunoglobulin-like domain-containing protein [Jeotgalibacillus salarius]TFE04030.1 hypothetical protein E2626_01495 [Jeotgalibacillus salarius]